MSKRFYYPNIEIDMKKINKSIPYNLSITTGSDVYLRMNNNGEIRKAEILKLKCGIFVCDPEERKFLIFHSKDEWYIKCFSFNNSKVKEYKLNDLRIDKRMSK